MTDTPRDPLAALVEALHETLPDSVDDRLHRGLDPDDEPFCEYLSHAVIARLDQSGFTLDAARPSDDAHMADWDVTTDSDHDPYGAADANRPMTVTPRPADPLAALLDPENAPAVHGAWHPRTRRSDDVQLLDDDGCTLFVSQEDVAALVAFRLDAARPSDDALRAAAQASIAAWDDKWIGCAEMAAPMEDLRAALATAPPSPDVEGLRWIILRGGLRLPGFDHWREKQSAKPSDPDDIRWDCSCGYSGSPETVERHWAALRDSTP